MLKRASYLNGVSATCWVVYVILGDRCFFSGITPPPSSTINFAEDIIESICDQENLDPKGLRFFDLQTHSGYSKLSGEYELDELFFDGKYVRGFEGRECPEEVLELFQEFIGPAHPSLVVYQPEAARSKGFGPSDMHAPNHGACFNYIGCAAGGLIRNAAMIVVDNSSDQGLLDKSYGHRYSVWARSTVSNN